ncbi:MAG: GTPase [Gammaproteobacteria bacterium]
MPANLTADYRKAEAAYRQANEPGERLACLKDMLRTIPKHKGTDHLQADIKTRIKELTAELSGGGKGARRAGPVHAIHAEGAAQIALLGPPNSGKSSLHARLTGSHTPIGPYPLTTHEPIPGMLPHEDALLQLIDLPAISADYMEPWIVNALQPADAVMLVIDIADPECVDQVPTILRQLKTKKVFLTEHWPGTHNAAPPRDPTDADDPDPFRIELPTVLVANKSDLDPEPEDVRVLEELIEVSYPTMFCSAQSGQGCDEISPFLFEALGVVRVYTKSPGKPFERDKPFTVRRGDTIHDVARLVHKDFAQGLRYARVWGEGVFDGQQVGTDHEVSDGEIVELHLK